MNSSERRAKKWLEEAGWTVYRNGWPDFLAVRQVNGKVEVRGIEVKSSAGELSRRQIAMIMALEGTLPVFEMREEPWMRIRVKASGQVVDIETNVARAMVKSGIADLVNPTGGFEASLVDFESVKRNS